MKHRTIAKVSTGIWPSAQSGLPSLPTTLQYPVTDPPRPKTALRAENSLCADDGTILRGQNPVCADGFHFARRFSGLRGSTPVLRGLVSVLRGRNPICGLKIRFARAFFTLRGPKAGF
jgi:hypothetical protein